MNQDFPIPVEELWDYAQELSDQGKLGGLFDHFESILSELKGHAENRFTPDARGIHESQKNKARKMLDSYPEIKTKWLGKSETAGWTRKQQGVKLDGLTRSILARVRKDSERLEHEGRLKAYTWMTDPAVQMLDDERFRQHFPGAKPGNPIQVGLLIGIAVVAVVILVACYFFCA